MLVKKEKDGINHYSRVRKQYHLKALHFIPKDSVKTLYRKFSNDFSSTHLLSFILF